MFPSLSFFLEIFDEIIRGTARSFRMTCCVEHCLSWQAYSRSIGQ